MKVKLIKIKKIGENIFEVTTLVDGNNRKDVIHRNTDIFIESMDKNLTYFTAEDQDFHIVWGNSFELRKEISEKIDEIVNQTKFQPA